MALIRPRFFAALWPVLLLGAPAFSQSGAANPVPLTAEIGDIERSLETNLTGPERRETYIKLARLQQLSGNVEAAARSWREAAWADPENRDGRSLLESSLCYLALGEFDAASDVLLGVVAGGDSAGVLMDAQYISAQIELFRSGSAASLYALLSKPEYADYRPAIYYTFWRIFGDEAYRTQLLTEFPGSPEARILQNEVSEALAATGAGSASAVGNFAVGFAGKVSAQTRPLWFLYPGRGNVVIGASVSVPPPAAPEQSGPRALQTGLFSREENARASAARLSAQGFAATVSRKPVNGVVYWAVSVAPGEDANWTIMRLKDAGFESFPVF
jgi:hypothetical protein